jgi:hypothetical protein
MAVGNTFGATALSSYGGFWISFAILFTPGGFEIASALGTELLPSVGFYLIGWFIFTTILLFCTMRSTVMFFLLFFWLDLAFLLLGVGYLQADAKGPNSGCIKGEFLRISPQKSEQMLTNAKLVASLVFSPHSGRGIMPLPVSWTRPTASSHCQWYVSEYILNFERKLTYFLQIHFPWSEKGRERRTKAAANGTHV